MMFELAGAGQVTGTSEPSAGVTMYAKLNTQKIFQM